MENESSYQRLLQVLNYYVKEDARNRSVSSFQKDFGLGNGFFYQASKRKTEDSDKKLNQSTLQKIHIAQPTLNIEGLKSGKGDMWIKNVPSKTDQKGMGRPYFNVDFLGGFDLMINDQTTVPETYISMDPYNKDNIYWCNLTGDSMSPLIKSGSKICLRHIEEGVSGIIFGDVYAIVTKSDMRTVKWVVRANDDAKIRLVPENKDAKYGDYQDVFKSDVRTVFKVELAVNQL